MRVEETRRVRSRPRRCRVNSANVRQSRPDYVAHARQSMAHVRQSRPYSGLDFQVKVVKPCTWFPLRSEAVWGGRRCVTRACLLLLYYSRA